MEAKAAGANGSWIVQNVEAGEYVLTVADGTGADYQRLPLLVEAGMPPVIVTIEAVQLAGRVLLGDDGVAAELTLRADSGEKVKARSDAAGDYRTLLPFAGTWKVDVRLAERRQEVTAKPLHVAPRDGEAARSDIVLPAARIVGRIVNESGKPTRGAVIVTRNRSPLADVVTEDGSFEVVGIEPGPVLINATSGSSQSGAIAVDATEHPSAVTLVLRKSWKIEGWLLSTSGNPVGGASIWYWTPGTMFIETEVTSPSGRFELHAEAQAASITLAITAPGLPAKLMIVPSPRDGEPLEVIMRSQAARLIVALHGDVPPWPVIGHDGAFAAMSFLLPPRYGPEPPARVDGGVALDVEPGNYSICGALDAASTCVQQQLAPGATVRVEAPARPSQDKK
jgi:hypothetical protein